MRDGGAAGQQVTFGFALSASRQFEDAAGPLDQGVESLRRIFLDEIAGIFVARKRKHRLQPPTVIERRRRGDLVGTIGQRRHQGEDRVVGRERAAAFKPFMELACDLFDHCQRGRDLAFHRPTPRWIDRRKAMTGNADGQCKRQGWWPLVLPFGQSATP